MSRSHFQRRAHALATDAWAAMYRSRRTRRLGLIVGSPHRSIVDLPRSRTDELASLERSFHFTKGARCNRIAS